MGTGKGARGPVSCRQVPCPREHFRALAAASTLSIEVKPQSPSLSRQQRSRIRAKAHGLCQQCYKPSRPGRVLCQKCSDKGSAQVARYWKENPDKARRYAKAQRAKRPDYSRDYYHARKAVAASLFTSLKEILAALPKRRLWLDPALERSAGEAIAAYELLSRRGRPRMND